MAHPRISARGNACLAMLSLPFFFIMKDVIAQSVEGMPSGEGEEVNVEKQAAAPVCPWWFKYIDSDLEPWRMNGGIQLADVESANKHAHMRIQIIGGRLFVSGVRHCFQTRAEYTLLGFLALLRKFPGIIPDVDLAINCEDKPIFSRDDTDPSESTPILLQYCNDASHRAVVFPDWSFWGWPEMRIWPWEKERYNIEEGGRKVGEWTAKIPRAFWRGNPQVAGVRQKVVGCSGETNNSVEAYGTHTPLRGHSIFDAGYASLQDMCRHRYRIYVEGRGWSVSLKYMLPCHSAMFFIEPNYYDFYSRGILESSSPTALLIPIDGMCKNLEDTVKRLNENEKEGEDLANRAFRFASDELSMEIVYSYMLYLLKAYSSLQRFTPIRSPQSEELTLDSMVEDIVKLGIEPEYFQQMIYGDPPCLLTVN